MQENPEIDENWTEIIHPQANLFQLNLHELWQYRDLIYLFVRRDFVATYKQTIFGIGWYFLEPLITTLIFTIIFTGIANISTDENPPTLFYMSSIVIWNFFAKALRNNAVLFTANTHLFGKVYFPRLTVAISNTISGLLAFGFQFLMLMILWVYFYWHDANIQFTMYAFLIPIFLILMGLMGLSLGVLVSALTTKYRDLAIFINFGIQLLMYFCPIIYPVSSVPPEGRLYLLLNPITPVVEGFRYALLGNGTFEWWQLGYACVVCGGLFVVSVLIFNRVQRNFMDTV